MTEELLSLTARFTGPLGYVLLGVCACIENLVPPIPGDTVTVFGGYLSGIGQLHPAGVVAATTTGNFAGFMLLYALGRRLGPALLQRPHTRFLPLDKMNLVAGWFARYGCAVILANRFLSGARSVISICAGISGLPGGKVALYCLVSCLVWNLLLVSAGTAVGENWNSIVTLLKRYNSAVVMLLCIGAAVWWAFTRLRRHRS